MSILGNRVLRTEDPKLLTAGGTYVDDVPVAGAAWVSYVRSSVPHGRVVSIDADAAREAPGVLDVVVPSDLDLDPVPPDMGMFNRQMVRPWLAGEVVRYAGEPVAAVVTDQRYQGEDATEHVLVDYEPLPAVVEPERAETGEVLVHEAAGTNVAFALPAGDHTVSFEDCEVVVRGRLNNQRVAPCPLEVRSAAARWEDDGRLTFWVSTQGPHSVRATLARIYGLDESRVRVICPDVGGGFGAKGASYPEELLLPWLARRVGRPVKWVEHRSESMVNLGHGRGQVQEVEIGGRRDGTIERYRLKVLQDAGAYPRMGAVLPFMTRTMLTGVYRVPEAQFDSVSVVTNTTPTVAYRGAGRPEAAAAIERAVDMFAAEIGMDPAEVRRRNLVPADAFPYRATVGTTYDSGDYERALGLVLDAAGYDELRAEQQRRRAAGDRYQLGVGLSIYVEITAGGGGQEFAGLEVLEGRRARLRVGAAPQGQGHATAWAMLVSDRLGIPVEQVEVAHGDTDATPLGGLTGGSRSAQVVGSAVTQASASVLDRAREVAAELLEARPDDVVLDVADGAFHVAGTPAVRRSWDEVLTAAGEVGIAAEEIFQAQGSTFPFGAHLAVVEVDEETGRVTLQRLVACDDAGTILNPLLAEGQIHGGLAQGAAQALLEEFRYDADGNPLTANFADYGVVSATELPSFERIPLETPTPLNELGAKGIGESGTIGATPAVQNAVVDALAHLGVRHVPLPATPETVWRTIRGAVAAG